MPFNHGMILMKNGYFILIFLVVFNALISCDKNDTLRVDIDSEILLGAEQKENFDFRFDESSSGQDSAEFFEAEESYGFDEESESEISDCDREEIPDSDTRSMETIGWILLDTNREHISEVLKRAEEFDVTAIHLSHGLIMDIDDIDDAVKAELIRDVAVEAHQYGLKVYVWAHELTGNAYFVCYDPDDSYWERRKNKYKEALTKIPEIDGIVLMYGSSDPDPWHAQCSCLFSSFDCNSIGNKPVFISDVILDKVYEAVVEEMGRDLIFRTFIHFPNEEETILQALSINDKADFTVMSKGVPQDWQPYHPHNVQFGNSDGRNHVAEFDLAGEYWGRSVIPFALPEYLQYRLSYQYGKGSNGAFGRIERGSYYAFGTPNEINLYAFTKLLKNVNYPVENIWKEWVEKRYGLKPGSEGSSLVISALKRTFDIGRKMYYVKGFLIEKGSDIPEDGKPGSVLSRKKFDVKTISQWNPDYTAWYDELKSPNEQTLRDIIQEKHEARYLSDMSVGDIEKARSFLKEEDYDDLLSRLKHQRDCVEIWDHVHQAMWHYRLGSDAGKKYLAWNLRELQKLASHMETEWGTEVFPGNPERIRKFIDSLSGETGGNSPEAPQQVKIENIGVSNISESSADVMWQTSEDADSQVEFWLKIPLYGLKTPLETHKVKDHKITLINLMPGTRYHFRVISTDSTGKTVYSGDFSFKTK